MKTIAQTVVAKSVIRREMDGGALRFSARVIDLRARFVLEPIPSKGATYSLVQYLCGNRDVLMMGNATLKTKFLS
jgi:hypothetical protein